MRKTTTDHVLLVQHQLTERDWRLLGWLYDHSVLTSFQIAQALFPSLNRAQRRLTQLTQLTELGLLERFRPFRLQGGSHPYHYALAHTGALVVAAARGDEPPRRAASTTGCTASRPAATSTIGSASTSSSPTWPHTNCCIPQPGCTTGGPTPG
jgi:hypothetical protein